MAGKKRISEETPHSGDDRGWRLAQLAVGLIREKLIVAKDSDGRIIHELNNETQISMALEAASYLLDAADRHSYVQHAYQLFDDDEHLSLNAIATRFKSADWKGLTSYQTVEEILKPILRRLKDVEIPLLLGPHTPEPYLAHLPHSSVETTLQAFWLPLKELEIKSGKSSGKRYFVRRIFLLAKFLFSEKFSGLRRPYQRK